MTPQRSIGKTRPGYVALITVLVLSSILLVGGIGVVVNQVNESRESLAEVNKDQARLMADTCADTAVLKLKQNNGYTGNEVVTVDTLTCQILAVTVNGDARTVNTVSTVGGVTSRIKVDIGEVSTMTITGWAEIP